MLALVIHVIMAELAKNWTGEVSTVPARKDLLERFVTAVSQLFVLFFDELT